MTNEGTNRNGGAIDKPHTVAELDSVALRSCFPVHKILRVFAGWLDLNKEKKPTHDTTLQQIPVVSTLTMYDSTVEEEDKHVRLENNNFSREAASSSVLEPNSSSLLKQGCLAHLRFLFKWLLQNRNRNSMRRSNDESTFLPNRSNISLSGPRKQTSRDERSDWRIGAGERNEISRNQLTRRHSVDWNLGNKQSGMDCGVSTSQWLDLFRNRYNSWATSCRGTIGDVLMLRNSSEGNHAGTKTLSRQRAASERCSSNRIGRYIAPRQNGKIVYFIRHGIAYCNVCRFTNWLEDQRLTPRGWNQVALLRSHLETIPQPEVVFTSTLSRAMETAVGAFGIPCNNETRPLSNNLLMAPQESVYNLQTRTQGVYIKSNTPPIVACEDCRERLGKFVSYFSLSEGLTEIPYCSGDGVIPNRRRKLSEAKKQFPGIDFSSVKNEKDTLFEKFERPEGESDEDLERRATSLIRFLLQRPESRIAVVSHGHFLSFLLNLYQRTEEYCNAELRSYEVSTSMCTTISTELWFKPNIGSHMEI